MPTNSSHVVSVSKTISGDAPSSRFLTWDVRGCRNFFCSLPGILRIIEILLVLVVLILASVGGPHGFMSSGGVDADFTCVGGSISLLMILLIFAISNIIGQHVPNILEVMTTLIGALLMMNSGSVAASYHFSLSRYLPAGLALGALAIITGLVFLLDFILNVRKLIIESENNAKPVCDQLQPSHFVSESQTTSGDASSSPSRILAKIPSKSVTISSHVVSMTQTISRFLDVRGCRNFFCSQPGILRIFEFLLVLVVLILFRGGSSRTSKTWGLILISDESNPDGNFGVASYTLLGSSIFLLMILLMFTISTIIGQHVPNILELMTIFIGAVLMITHGSLAVTYHSSRSQSSDTPAGLSLGALAISAGILFLVDFILNVRKLRSEMKNNEDSKTNSGKDDLHEIIF